ncbi:MAG: hypothetical protein Q8O61_18800, partial [Nocardioides sp.]|nr:hypothetical protein [Nocardioides sp.]
MPSGSHASPTRSPRHERRERRARGAWRIGTPVVVLLSGTLFAVSAYNSDGTDLRPGRYSDLAGLVENEAEEYDELQARLDSLTTDVTTLTANVDDRAVRRLRRQVETLDDPAGLAPRSGPGITVTLSDASEETINETTRDVNLLVVHQ